ncbi:inactive serine protease PAMR1 [Brachyhypopomus gauderio]|uniref:inactive serine protease PAMR1 n=1 Tax=Brachyhypopomus gauderio TaxID=698409 RepID=UPI00404271F2
MPSAARLHGLPRERFLTLPHCCLLFVRLLLVFLLVSRGQTWPHDYRFLYNYCPGAEWSVMCRGCCEYEVIRCKCPVQGASVGYAVPCCRNARQECDPCIIHPGCSIFENCKRCNNGTWGPRDDFFVKSRYCAECRPGWSGGDCMTCGGVIRKRQGHLVLESYPTNARCEWTLQVNEAFTVELRFMMLSLEFDHSCRYDYVEVRDGDSINSRVIGRFCGNERPAPIQSTGNSLHILFVSDGYKNFDGLFAIFQENSACTSSPCLHDGTCILDSSHSYHCACLAGFTGQRCEHVLACSRPAVPEHGSVESVDVRVGGQVLFTCQPNFSLQGFPMSTCMTDGSWSTPAPLCVPEKNCPIPPKPSHGDHFLVYGPNDVLLALQYLCYRPHTLMGTPQRMCLANNTWSGSAPTCVIEEDIVPVPDKDIKKEDDGGKDKQTEFLDKTRQETETTPDKAVSLEIPTRGKEKTSTDISKDKEQDVVKDPEKDAGTDKHREGSKDQILIKAPEDSVKMDRKKDTDGDLDSGDKGVKVLTNDLDMNSVDFVLIEDIVTVKETIPDPDNATEKETEETTTDLPQYTIVSLRKDEKDNVFYKVHTSGQSNDTEPVDSNDIDAGLGTQQPKDTRKITLEATDNNSTEKITVSTPDPQTEDEKITVKPDETRHGGEHKQEGLPGPAPEVLPTGQVQVDRGPEAAGRQPGQDMGAENLSVVEAEGRKCPPPPRLYHGFYEWVPGVDPETVEFSCNHSYALSGSARRTCLANGTWDGAQPICVRACREPKVSVLVRQKVLPPQVPFRKTPVHKFYSSTGLMKIFNPLGPTKGPPSLSPLPRGFHHLYTHIEYECSSPYYHHTGSTRRTCLKTGKWSGRHVSCTPVCGKLPNYNPQRPVDSHWPWLAAIYRLSGTNGEAKPRKQADPTGGVGKQAGPAGGVGEVLGLTDGYGGLEAGGWQLVCSGALLNQRSVVVAAHCVTELGKLYPLEVATVRVVLGKRFRHDLRHNKGLQQLRVSSIAVHPNYDPLVLDSDLAVMKLLDKARVGEHVLPICLPDAQDTQDNQDTHPRQAMVTGWSLNQDPGAGEREQAHVGLVRLGDVVHCEQQFAQHGVPIGLSDNMLCARQEPGATPSNICPAETGGVLILPPTTPDPASLLAPNPAQGWKLLGLVSFGYDSLDCNPELYTVYTQIANFIDFLEGNMK